MKCNTSCSCRGLCGYTSPATTRGIICDKLDPESLLIVSKGTITSSENEVDFGTKTSLEEALHMVENCQRKITVNHQKHHSNSFDNDSSSKKSTVNREEFVDLNPENHISTPPIPLNVTTCELSIHSGITSPHLQPFPDFKRELNAEVTEQEDQIGNE